jgi:hypothetical protein
MRVISGSVLLFSAEICVISGNFGCNEAKIEKQSRYAQIEAWWESCPKRCRREIRKLRLCVGATDGADALGEICICDFPAAALRNP